jgi:hypothetical protein
MIFLYQFLIYKKSLKIMDYSDLGDSYEWESEFVEWLKTNSKPSELTDSVEGVPQIKKEYSENFILQNILDEN